MNKKAKKDDGIFVSSKTYEEIRKENEVRREELRKQNNALRGTQYHPTVSEEMNIITDPNFRYIGKGSL